MRKSELEETLLRQAAFDDSITATTPMGRDFVTVRLTIRRDVLNEQVAMMAAQASRMNAAVEAGRAPQSELHAIEHALQDCAGDMALLDSMIELRQRVVTDQVLHPQAELELMRLKQEASLGEADRALNAIALEHERIAKLAESAMASQRELRGIERELEVAQIKRDALQQQVAVIDQMIEQFTSKQPD